MSDVALTEPAWAEPLYAAVTGRPRPEDVAKLALSLFPDLPHAHKWRARARGVSYMSTRHASPEPLTHSANVLATLLGEPTLTADDTFGLPLELLLAKARSAIAAPEGPLDFRHGRLDGAARYRAGLEMSRRRYNKLFRLVRFLESEREGNERYAELCGLMVGAKSGILRHLPREVFARDRDTALFVSYMAARLSMRSVFTVDPQERAFDDLAAALLRDLERSRTTEWYAVAHAFPRADVLARISDGQRLALVALALEQMLTAARLLERLARENGIDFGKGFVVRKGQDSSGWNAAAGAWNKARDSWMGLSRALGLDVSAMLPGKAPRLMAADVVAWQRSLGRPAHPDERIAADLPAPWNVLLHGAECSERAVREACLNHGVDPAKSGWTAPRERTAVEAWRPTPELVHGVVVSDPLAAAAMRRLGWFSGPAKWERENFGAKNA
jgi:hypothetical protein